MQRSLKKSKKKIELTPDLLDNCFRALAQKYGWTPDVIGRLTYSQISVFLEDITTPDDADKIDCDADLLVCQNPETKETFKQMCERRQAEERIRQGIC